MLNKLSFLVIAILASITNFSQEKYVGRFTGNAQCIYGEILGNGLTLSANYDIRFRGQKGLGLRVGLGYLGSNEGGILSIPVGINHLSGIAPNYLEVGIGYTFVRLTGTDNILNGSGAILVPNIGYRYQPLQKGVTIRIGLSPLI
jgi:hypothetical protein